MKNHTSFIRTSSVSELPLSSSFRCSSAVEQLTVNQLVAGSNPATGASNRKALLRECFSVADAPREKRAQALFVQDSKTLRDIFASETKQSIHKVYWSCNDRNPCHRSISFQKPTLDVLGFCASDSFDRFEISISNYL